MALVSAHVQSTFKPEPTLAGRVRFADWSCRVFRPLPMFVFRGRFGVLVPSGSETFLRIWWTMVPLSRFRCSASVRYLPLVHHRPASRLPRAVQLKCSVSTFIQVAECAGTKLATDESGTPQS